jgi:tetratricopeptide (TPR) repeat protein
MKETLDINEQDLETLFERYRRSPESRVFVMLADACRKSDRVEEALEICEKGLERHPEYASAHVVKGKCLYDLERRDGARAAFETVLEFDPDNLVALKYLGMMEAMAGRFDSARRYLSHILRLDPDNPEITEALEHVDERRRAEAGDVEVSTVTRETARRDEFEASDELATITLADIYASQGYREKALKIYEEVLARQPHSETLKRKIAQLDRDAEEADGETFLDLDADDDSAGPREAPSSRASDEARTTGPLNDTVQERERRQPTREPIKRKAIDEERNIDHFKRWLEGLHK